MIIVIAFFAMIILSHWFVNKTQLGVAMRAVSQDKTAAAFMGIDSNRVITYSFIFGAVWQQLQQDYTEVQLNFCVQRR
jgi:branched-chain amino acid transport system permease protein